MILAALCAGMPCAWSAELQGRVTAVHDGDTLTLMAGEARLRVRLDGIDAPEPGQPYGRSAHRSLAALCRGKQASVVERGKDDAGRILGSVTCAEVDVNAEQVRRGMAWVHLRYLPLGSPLYEFEANARLRRVGLWRGKEPVAPWEWRARVAREKGKR
jgi:endonuclease YncB( thermonuclease family)